MDIRQKLLVAYQDGTSENFNDTTDYELSEDGCWFTVTQSSVLLSKINAGTVKSIRYICIYDTP